MSIFDHLDEEAPETCLNAGLLILRLTLGLFLLQWVCKKLVLPKVAGSIF